MGSTIKITLHVLVLDEHGNEKFSCGAGECEETSPGWGTLSTSENAIRSATMTVEAALQAAFPGLNE